MKSISNKVVWITGASSGIGEALTYELSKQNARLIISARRNEELERVKGNCALATQPNIQILLLDLSQGNTLQPTVDDAIRLFGHVDILVNNGGLGQRSLIQETSLEVDRRLMEVNYFGTIALTKYLLPHFINRKQGHIVTITSLTGKFGTPYRSAYAASKHALHGFFDALRAEHWKDNIHVTMICPGFIKTNLSVAALTGSGAPQNRMDKTSYNKKTPEWCARRIVRAIENRREEVYIGGREVLGIYIKRFFPAIFSKMIRKVPVR
nr:short chain dehydrogenase [uncultured bacterium]AIA10811.1 short chain dehydrogenase [uncultured bacterium]